MPAHLRSIIPKEADFEEYFMKMKCQDAIHEDFLSVLMFRNRG